MSNIEMKYQGCGRYYSADASGASCPFCGLKESKPSSSQQAPPPIPTRTTTKVLSNLLAFLGWAFGLLFLSGTLAFLNAKMFVVALFFLSMSILLIPPTCRYLNSLTNLRISGWKKAGVVAVLFVLAVVFTPSDRPAPSVRSSSTRTDGAPSSRASPKKETARLESVSPRAEAERNHSSDVSSQARKQETISGNGPTATKLIWLDPGAWVFSMQHSGSGHFPCWLMNSDGRKMELLANTTGPFKGSQAVGIEQAGNYLFNISANGEWSITVSPP